MSNDWLIDEDHLRRHVEARSIKSKLQFAMEHGIEYSNLRHFMHKRRPPPPNLLRALGYERVVMYRRKS